MWVKPEQRAQCKHTELLQGSTTNDSSIRREEEAAAALTLRATGVGRKSESPNVPPRDGLDTLSVTTRFRPPPLPLTTSPSRCSDVRAGGMRGGLLRPAPRLRPQASGPSHTTKEPSTRTEAAGPEPRACGSESLYINIYFRFPHDYSFIGRALKQNDLTDTHQRQQIHVHQLQWRRPVRQKIPAGVRRTNTGM